ncbi:MAG: biotin--[acetyl-CoA-carboxylase] ligase [Steroidobacteraceae bacterium]|nr:biotin--[acetyl-CoA-carboxylase] ligase [Steroidobacteraceae bacterium]MDW8259066.1 biotin--[acetyl-CoA-carboxylase] ligase [Gammaproteobacteria bacterium]
MRAAPLPLVQALFADLADGRWHSGAALARRHRVTRAAVWKAVEQLRELGLPLRAAQHRGYALERSLAPLDAAKIRAALPQDVGALIERCDIVWTTPSTNAELLARPPAAAGRWQLLLAENQSAGRGRRGRRWQSALGCSLCVSLGLALAELPAEISALTLVAGLAVCRAAGEAGATDLQLKWPNDLVRAGAKLGGILTELRAEAGGPAWVVVGIGLNLYLTARERARIRRSGVIAGDLATAGLAVDRNTLVVAILTQFSRDVAQFLREGFAPFAERWRAVDALRDRPVVAHGFDAHVAGIARGIDPRGALLIETPAGMRTVIGGDITLRDSP